MVYKVRIQGVCLVDASSAVVAVELAKRGETVYDDLHYDCAVPLDIAYKESDDCV